MPEITSLADAQTRIRNSFRVQKNLPDNILDDYARIAYFLRGGAGAPFVAAIDAVSAELWTRYRHFQTQGSGLRRNRFTDAIRNFATPLGFMFDENKVYNADRVVLTGGIDGEAYLNWIKSGVLFKDMLDAKHGEHSHTFQWLAIAHTHANNHAALGLNKSPSALYRAIYDVVPKNSEKTKLVVPGFKMKPKNRAQGSRTGVSLWSWLVDCFPVSMASSQAIPDAESLFSDSYRTPQRVTKYLIDDTDDSHFIGTYLRYRYRKRRWMDSDGNYESIAGASSKSTGNSKHENNPRWKPLDGGNAFVRRPTADHTYDKKNKKLKMVNFHNVQGHLTDPDG